MTETTTPRPAARFIGQSVTRKEDPRLLTGHGEYVDDVSLPRHVARGVRAQRDRGRHDHEHRHQRRQGRSPVSSACSRGRTSTAATAKRGTRCSARRCSVPPPLAVGDVRYVGDVVALVVAESRYAAEDACELIEVDYEPTQAVVDFATAADDTEHLVHGAWGLQSNAMVAMPFMPISGDLDEAFASRRARRRVHHRAEPLHLRADGDAGDHRLVDARARRDGDHLRDAVGARDPQLLRPVPRHPGRRHHRHRARRRRRLRPEDVRVP